MVTSKATCNKRFREKKLKTQTLKYYGVCFFYFFPYEDTENEFNIPHDLKILKEVFNIKNGKYINKNYYWKSYNIQNLINNLKIKDRKILKLKLNKIKNLYLEHSRKYQLNKKNTKIPLK